MNELTALARELSPKSAITVADPNLPGVGGLAVIRAVNSDGTVSVVYNGSQPFNVNVFGNYVPAVGTTTILIIFGTQVWAAAPGVLQYDTIFKPFTYQNGWSDYSSGTYSPSGYRKLVSGLVVMQGAITGGGTGVFATLPLGYRPSISNVLGPILCTAGGTNQLGYYSVSSNGQCFVATAASGIPSNAWINFSFLATQ